eukprot:COSAG02_NODE_19_length_53976_cov_37.338512_41_plen_104_part_00
MAVYNSFSQAAAVIARYKSNQAKPRPEVFRTACGTLPVVVLVTGIPPWPPMTAHPLVVAILAHIDPIVLGLLGPSSCSHPLVPPVRAVASGRFEWTTHTVHSA